VQRTTKLTEGGHRGLQDYRHICYYFHVFTLTNVFCRVSYVFLNYAHEVVQCSLFNDQILQICSEYFSSWHDILNSGWHVSHTSR